MLLTAISSIPIRNTTVESTASGMYWSGLVRNSSTTSTTPAQVSDASWLRPPAPSTICVLVGLPLTTKVPDTPAAALARPRPTRSTSSLNRSPYLAAKAREVAALWARITMKIENLGLPDVNRRVGAPVDVRQPQVGQAAGHVSEHRHAVALEVEHLAEDDRADHGDQRARHHLLDVL